MASQPHHPVPICHLLPHTGNTVALFYKHEVPRKEVCGCAILPVCVLFWSHYTVVNRTTCYLRA